MITYTREEQAAMAVRYTADRQRYAAELAARRETYRREQTPHNLRPGDVVVNSWGYDQTNIDFYEVTRATSHFVWLRKLQQTTKETGFMCGPTAPIPSQYDDTEPESKHKAYMARDYDKPAPAVAPCVNFKYGSGHKWSGRPENCSWYA